MADPRNIVLLGATGSIGESTLSVIRKFPERFSLLGIAANRNAGQLRQTADRFKVPHRTLYAEEGTEGLVRLATLEEADIVVVATTGTAGLEPTAAALEAGKTVALANKETLVLGGELIMRLEREGQGRILPVDSEHNAIFQCLEACPRRSLLKRILLTASGGPFLHHTRSELQSVTVEEALRHPNWDMGPKVTVDSATMANKGLEMIEARWLFDLQVEQIDVVVHPQSLIHSMIEFKDGSVITQMAPPSMTFPIQHVLSYPERLDPCVPGLDFTRIHQLVLRPPDVDRFPCLKLASEALARGGIAPAAYNAANEVAVQAFLDGGLRFIEIPALIEACLESAAFPVPSDLSAVRHLHSGLMEFARSLLDKGSY